MCKKGEQGIREIMEIDGYRGDKLMRARDPVYYSRDTSVDDTDTERT
jgi:hypothetical protein